MNWVKGISPANGHGLARRELWALSVFYFMFHAALGLTVAYGPIYLKDRGLTLPQIGALAAAMAVSGGLTQVLIGHYSDYLGSRRMIGALSCASLGVSYIAYGFAHSFRQFLPLYIWSGVSYFGALTLPQTIISDWTSAAGSTARGFSATRIWGTIGFIVSLVIATFAPCLVRGTLFLYGAAALFFAAAVPLLIAREAPVVRTARGMFCGAAAVLRSQSAYVLLGCFTLYRLCESGVTSYLGLYLKGMGGGDQLVAAAYWINAVAETPLVLCTGAISDRVGRKGLIAFAFLIFVVRLYFYSIIRVPGSVYYIQLLHGFTYGITLVVSVAYMSDIAPKDLRGTAQSLLSVSNAAAMALGPLLVGYIGKLMGLAAAFQVMAGIVFFAFIFLAAFAREPAPLSSQEKSRG